MKRVLVTGACGFVGRWVVQKLVRDGYEVCAFDINPTPGSLEFAQEGLSSRVEMFRGDITSLDDVMHASRDCVKAVHLAGIMTVDCRKDPLRGARINVIGSLNVFEAALKYGFARVTYVSTAGVFGTTDPVNPHPETHYGAFKLAVEGSARAYWHDHGLPSVGFRPYIVYGQGVSSGIAAGPSIALLAAHENREALIRFSGRVGFVYVEDVAEAFVAAIKTDVSANCHARRLNRARKSKGRRSRSCRSFRRKPCRLISPRYR